MSQIKPGYGCVFIRSICGSKTCPEKTIRLVSPKAHRVPSRGSQNTELAYQPGHIMAESGINKTKHSSWEIIEFTVVVVNIIIFKYVPICI